MTFLPSIKISIQRLWRECWRQLAGTRVRAVWLLVLVLPLFGLLAADHTLIAAWRLPEDSWTHRGAGWLSRWGDFYNGCAGLIALIFFYGVARRQPHLRLLALAMLLSAVLAGAAATGLRFATGRPRPSTQSALVADGLYGPRFKTTPQGHTLPDYGYHSLPSAHATTAMATAVPLLVIHPAVGIPAVTASLLVGWSRFQLHRHHPSDVYLGLVLGGVVGLAFGRAVAQLYPAVRRAPTPASRRR